MGNLGGGCECVLAYFELFMAFLYSAAQGLADDWASVSTFINKHLLLMPLLQLPRGTTQAALQRPIPPLLPCQFWLSALFSPRPDHCGNITIGLFVTVKGQFCFIRSSFLRFANSQFWFTYTLWYTFLNLWVSWQGVNMRAFKVRRERQVLGHLSAYCGLLSAPMTPPGIMLGRVQAGIETPALSPWLTSVSRWSRLWASFSLSTQLPACLPSCPACLVAELHLPGVLMTWQRHEG